MTAPLRLTLDLFADPICPWCFIGKRNLERALATYEGPKLDCKISWRTFMLNPGMPPEGMNRGAYLEAKFGGAENAGAVYGRIRQAGLAAGLEFSFEKITRTPSTRAAHRAVRYVQETGKYAQTAAYVEALFCAYFFDGQDIGRLEVLADVGASVGVGAGDLWTMFDSEAYIQEINAEDVYAREMGMGGVPGFILNRQFFLSGAQPVAAFHKLFDLIQTGEHLAPQTGDGAAVATGVARD